MKINKIKKKGVVKRDKISETCLIVALGNPGSKYAETRHNVGFKVLDYWSRKIGVSMNRQSFNAYFARTRLQDKDIILLCPLTFMNLSGKSVRECIDYYRIENNNLLVVHDDIDLPVGRVKVVKNSGPAGHRGVLSIIQHIGTKDFARVRIGVGRPQNGEQVDQYVLSCFYKYEREIIERAIDLAAYGCELFVLKGVDGAMNTINCQDVST